MRVLGRIELKQLREQEDAEARRREYTNKLLDDYLAERRIRRLMAAPKGQYRHMDARPGR